ncbi:MAG: flagellar motor switch protein FliN [SAR324 cluster bacterium]|jgi:flagellar motor switch protein FliN/FliY|nr:flagellar motor switch protein FliN [SAR324 cluster bacterium]MDP6522035.1 flagellar motor switch protein FliN [SAR324 cluster bacterium]|tara:strand:+ start:298 stop:597 length:300 start_codon:yes stop_codon:yes gene_type:complete
MLGFDAENDDAIYHSSKFIEDVPLLIIAEIGRTQISVQKVLNLKKGNLVEFNKIVGEPMDVVVGGRLMARGEIVVVNERYGVRISEVTRPDEKIGERRE